MKKLSLRWRITFMTMIILVVTCVSMKVMICSSGMMQITELGNVVFDFTGSRPEGRSGDGRGNVRL